MSNLREDLAWRSSPCLSPKGTTCKRELVFATSLCRHQSGACCATTMYFLELLLQKTMSVATTSPSEPVPPSMVSTRRSDRTVRSNFCGRLNGHHADESYC